MDYDQYDLCKWNMSFNPSSFETNTLDIINIESMWTLQYRQDLAMSQYLK